MAENVKVAVRVRPFNDREKKRSAKLIIDMNGQSTAIKDPENMGAEPKKFAFDYSYWSHDSFKERSDGYYEPASSKYADQNKVFEDLGKGVLANAWKGYNTSLFAYGQTGSGKSYSMVGYGSNKGIVPLACNDLFENIEAKRKSAKEGDEFKVSFSMLEIYNEQVRDLLNPKTLKIKGGLKIRQHKDQSFYVETLTSAPVNSYKEIDAKINEGTQNRTVASTNMNATSSRAHTIVAIKFTQKSSESGQSMTKTSIINLVDLAGSERADATGATGDRLKEGSAINQSLSTLGNVIKALADQSTGKSKTVVPYRDSVLTKLLKNALGGNSKTVMIAALSPADINYEETLSTLRFADRAKAIKTKAVVNESPTDKLIRELREENQRLQDMLSGRGGAVASGGGGGGISDEGLSAEERAEKEALEAELEQNRQEMEEMKKNWQEQLKEQEAQMKAKMEALHKENENKKSMPHLWNLNEDPALSGKISHFINKGKSVLGNAQNEKAEIKLGGLGIMKEHVTFNNNKDEKVTMKPAKNAKVLLNGNEITGEKELHHNDRILFGNGSNLFVCHHPKDYAKQQKNKKVIPDPSFESAQQEIAEKSGLSKLMGNGTSKEDLLLQEDLIKVWPMLTEANAMSEELDKKVKFEIALIAPQARGKKNGRTEVSIKYKHLTHDTEFFWPMSKFIDRKFQMQEMYSNYQEGDSDWDKPKAEDPFYEDPSQETLIGAVHVYLQALAYKIDIKEQLQITDYKGTEKGFMNVECVPTDKNGKLIEDEFVEDPSELVGRDLNFEMKIQKAMGLKKDYAKTFCRYKVYLEDQSTTTNELTGRNPEYDHKKLYSFNPVTKALVDYLEEEPMIVEVYGRQKDKEGDSGLNTEELMKKDKTVISGGAKSAVLSTTMESVDLLLSTQQKRKQNRDVSTQTVSSKLWPQQQQQQQVEIVEPSSSLWSSCCMPYKSIDVRNEHHYKLAAEANTYKKRMERAEAKLAKIRALVDKANKEKKDTIKRQELDKLSADTEAKKAAPAKGKAAATKKK